MVTATLLKTLGFVVGFAAVWVLYAVFTDDASAQRDRDEQGFDFFKHLREIFFDWF